MLLSSATSVPISLPALSGAIYKRYKLPAVLMRCGTSKGLFFHRECLPSSTSEWEPLIAAAMGSKDSDLKQLDGIGGGTSTTSKVIVVNKSTRSDIDIEYTFIQVAVGQNAIDMTGNCGNMCSGVAAFAVDEGLIKPTEGAQETSVRVYNTNTGSVILQTIQLDTNGMFREDGEYIISGVRGTGSPIMLTFQRPIGSMTGRLFPTGERQEDLAVDSKVTVRVTMIDSANPFVFVDASTMPNFDALVKSPDSLETQSTVESIRAAAAVKMGLALSSEQASLTKSTPKIAFLFSPSSTRGATSFKSPDIAVLAYSMGKKHPSLQLTGAVTLGAALSLNGTVASDIALRKKDHVVLTPPGSPESFEDEATSTSLSARETFVIQHSSGLMETVVSMDTRGIVESVTVFRTVRRLFEGLVRFGVWQKAE